MTDDEEDTIARAKATLRDHVRREEAKSATRSASLLVRVQRTIGTSLELWARFLRPVWNLFGWPIKKYWSFCRWVFEKMSMTAEGMYSNTRGAGTIFALLVFTIFFGFQLVTNAIPLAARFAYDAVAINSSSQTEVLVFGQPDGVEGNPDELVVYACRRYPCEAQFDSVEFRIRDSTYLDVVSYVRHFQPHYPGELAGAFVSEENACKVRYYGWRVKLIGLYPKITHAVCQPISGADANAALASVRDLELR